MKDRIRQIMESQHMTQQTFSQFLGISSAALSSLYNGRTKPTINIVEAIHHKMPQISTSWLMYGEGDMYVGGEAQKTGREPVENKPQPLSTLFDTDTIKNSKQVASKGKKDNDHQGKMMEGMKIVDNTRRHIVEIKVYYDDLTYESFVPSKH